MQSSINFVATQHKLAHAIVRSNIFAGIEKAMSVTWNTKFGGRRVRLNIGGEEVKGGEEIREAALRIRRRPERTNRLSIAAPRRMEAPRTVVVEYKGRRSVR